MSQQEKKIFSSVHINRITVEFKFLRVSLYYPFSSILIESQWNLNNSFTAFSCSGAIDINRITVEFKYSDIAVLLTNISILIESQWNLNCICK